VFLSSTMPQLSILSRRNGVTKILCGDCPNQRRLTLFSGSRKRVHFIEEKNVISFQLYHVAFGLD
jgi:hypothetical protein